MTRPQRAITWIFIGVLVLTAVGIAWSNRDIDSGGPVAQAFKQARPDTAWFASSSSKSKPPSKPREQLIEDLYQLILTQHPEMAIPWKDVPDKSNGRLQLERLFHKHGGNLTLPADIRDMTYDPKNWRADRAIQWCTENQGLLEEITAVGLLPGQSAKVSSHLVSPDLMKLAQWAKQCTDLLCLHAQVHAAQGNADLALRALQAAMGIADHVDQIEAPCLLDVSVSVLIRMSVSHICLEHVLPKLPANMDLTEWQKVVLGPSFPPSQLAAILRGEWHGGIRIAIAEYYGSSAEEMPRDPERMIRAWAKFTKDQMDTCGACADWSLLPKAIAAVKPDTKGLSKQSELLVSTLQIGLQQYVRGLARTAAVQSLSAAGFAHLRGEPLPNEPVTGRPYVWDAASKTLSPPADPRLSDMKLKPIKLPR